MISSHWRNILHHHDEPDEIMQRIDAQVAPLEEFAKPLGRIGRWQKPGPFRPRGL